MTKNNRIFHLFIFWIVATIAMFILASTTSCSSSRSVEKNKTSERTEHFTSAVDTSSKEFDYLINESWFNGKYDALKTSSSEDRKEYYRNIVINLYDTSFPADTTGYIPIKASIHITESGTSVSGTREEVKTESLVSDSAKTSSEKHIEEASHTEVADTICESEDFHETSNTEVNVLSLPKMYVFCAIVFTMTCLIVVVLSKFEKYYSLKK